MAKHYRSIQTTPFFSRSKTMPSSRRIRLYGVLVILFVVTILFYTSSNREARDPQDMTDFYGKTMSGLNRKVETVNVAAQEDEEVARQMALRLKEAAQVAKDKANAKAPKPDPPSAVVGKGSAADGAGADRSVAGRKKMGGAEDAQAPLQEEETQEDHDVTEELNSILKKSPVIIFSKSYCPHSKRAKGILLDKYIIDPAPFVVELDQHPLGQELQARLGELTGRRTVPNTLINGVSIGGGDDVAELDSSSKLIEKIKDLGGKRMLDVRQKPVAVTADEAVEAHGL